MRVIFMQFSGAKKQAQHVAWHVLNAAGVALVAFGLLLASTQVRKHVYAFADAFASHTRPRKLALYCHHVFNRDMQKQLEGQAVQRIAKVSIARLDPERLFGSLQQKFPVIERVSWHMPRPLFAEMHVYGTMPTWRLGETHVIGANNVIYPASDFAEFDLQSLPRVSFAAATGHEVSPEIMQWLMALPEVVTRQFDVHYISKTQVQLRTPNGRLAVTARDDQVYDVKKLSAVTTLYGQLDATKRAQEYWHYDIRFQNQVVFGKAKNRK